MVINVGMEKDIALGFQLNHLEINFTSDNNKNSCKASAETNRMNKDVKEWCTCGLYTIMPTSEECL